MPYREFKSLYDADRFLDLKFNSKNELQEIVELTSELCAVPAALITQMDEDIQYIKFKVGTSATDFPKSETFCQYLSREDELLIIPDTLKDVRSSGLKMVAAAPYVRFYAGTPLITHDGINLGSLCLMSDRPGNLTNAQERLIKVLAKRIIQIIEFDSSLKILKEQFVKARDSETKLKSFFSSAGACYMLIDKKMNIIDFNKNMYSFVLKNHHIKLKAVTKINEILSGGQFDNFVLNYNKCLAGESLLYERKIDYEGETIWWSIALEPGLNSDNEIIGISFNATNITEKKIYEEQILNQHESLLKIAHMQSHELRRPVANVLGFVELFKLNGYQATSEELMLLGKAAQELDDKIKAIVALTQ